jgi:hypothetical protein
MEYVSNCVDEKVQKFEEMVSLSLEDSDHFQDVVNMVVGFKISNKLGHRLVISSTCINLFCLMENIYMYQGFPFNFIRILPP